MRKAHHSACCCNERWYFSGQRKGRNSRREAQDKQEKGERQRAGARTGGPRKGLNALYNSRNVVIDRCGDVSANVRQQSVLHDVEESVRRKSTAGMGGRGRGCRRRGAPCTPALSHAHSASTLHTLRKTNHTPLSFTLRAPTCACTSRTPASRPRPSRVCP
jgi:hypothetical protein